MLEIPTRELAKLIRKRIDRLDADIAEMKKLPAKTFREGALEEAICKREETRMWLATIIEEWYPQAEEDTESRKVYEFPILDEYIPNCAIKLILEKRGQELPSDGDEVVVRAKLAMPTSIQGDEIISDLAFSSRCPPIFHDSLAKNWGRNGIVDGYRARYKDFTAETYREAFVKAYEYTKQQLEPLFKLVDRRMEARVRAEEEYCRSDPPSTQTPQGERGWP